MYSVCLSLKSIYIEKICIYQYLSDFLMATQLCYNRGCGREFKVKENHDEACLYHPGAPYFHDAYKGWTCCQNKSTDFTTFLNTPGCSVGRHSNIKPVEPEKITGNLSKDEGPAEVIEVRPPIQPPMARPSTESERKRLIPTVAASLKQALQNLKIPDRNSNEGEVKPGDCCKNNGCKETFPPTSEDCKYHPGYPVFHEVTTLRTETGFSLHFAGHEILVVLPAEDNRVPTLSRSGGL